MFQEASLESHVDRAGTGCKSRLCGCSCSFWKFVRRSHSRSASPPLQQGSSRPFGTGPFVSESDKEAPIAVAVEIACSSITHYYVHGAQAPRRSPKFINICPQCEDALSCIQHGRQAKLSAAVDEEFARANQNNVTTRTITLLESGVGFERMRHLQPCVRLMNRSV